MEGTRASLEKVEWKRGYTKCVWTFLGGLWLEEEGRKPGVADGLFYGGLSEHISRIWGSPVQRVLLVTGTGGCQRIDRTAFEVSIRTGMKQDLPSVFSCPQPSSMYAQRNDWSQQEEATPNQTCNLHPPPKSLQESIIFISRN